MFQKAFFRALLYFDYGSESFSSIFFFKYGITKWQKCFSSSSSYSSRKSWHNLSNIPWEISIFNDNFNLVFIVCRFMFQFLYTLPLKNSFTQISPQQQFSHSKTSKMKQQNECLNDEILVHQCRSCLSCYHDKRREERKTQQKSP